MEVEEASLLFFKLYGQRSGEYMLSDNCALVQGQPG